MKEAHRQVPIVPRDWHLLGCQVTPGSSVYINKVGTFGISSASYCWSRVAGALGRLSQYLIGGKARTWHLLVADGFHLDASGPEYRAALLLFFVLCDTCRVPLSWAKTAGGDTVAWVGFELLHSSSCLGISQRLSRLVCQVVTRDCFLHVREHEQIRGGTWTYHVCRRRTRIFRSRFWDRCTVFFRFIRAVLFDASRLMLRSF